MSKKVKKAKETKREKHLYNEMLEAERKYRSLSDSIQRVVDTVGKILNIETGTYGNIGNRLTLEMVPAEVKVLVERVRSYTGAEMINSRHAERLYHLLRVKLEDPTLRNESGDTENAVRRGFPNRIL